MLASRFGNATRHTRHSPRAQLNRKIDRNLQTHGLLKYYTRMSEELLRAELVNWWRRRNFWSRSSKNPGTKTYTRYVYFWFRLRMGDAYVACSRDRWQRIRSCHVSWRWKPVLGGYLIFLLTSVSLYKDNLEANNLWLWGFEKFYQKKKSLVLASD